MDLPLAQVGETLVLQHSTNMPYEIFFVILDDSKSTRTLIPGMRVCVRILDSAIRKKLGLSQEQSEAFVAALDQNIKTTGLSVIFRENDNKILMDLLGQGATLEVMPVPESS